MLPMTVKARDRNALKGELGMGSRYPLCGVLAAALAVTASASQTPPVESDQQCGIPMSG
jgi:hypothetical protein